jgi:leader peptidase (prepilin peptidase) / N-methyltransferase
VHALVVAVSALLGVFVGAVSNLLIDRVPDKVSLTGPREGEVVPPQSWLGVPAQPWLLRAGRSADGPLPSRWLWVEIVTIAAFAELAVKYSHSWVLAPLLLLTASLITVSVIDLQLQRIPDRITFPTFLISVPAIVVV